jgi:serine/threonine protein kinase/WD40 repeat protein
MSMIGKSLVHYEITSEIGRGGMGEVYQAKDTKLGRDVAIKVLPEEFALDKDRVARFQREAKLLASLNHPNIAAIHGLEESEGIHFLVMELIEGQTLKDRIKSGPIPVEEALKLALQMAEALEAAHENGVIHRDLKPANIKVTPDGKVKILDFGLAKAYAGDQGNVSLADSPTISAAATQKGVILGTAAYMSPEQAKGKPVDKRADIWAFGVVFFEMLTGRQAFTGETVSDTLASVLAREPAWQSLPPNLHSRIRFLLERCLEKEAKDRHSGISDARVEIQKVLADPSGLFVQPSTITKPRKRMQIGLPLVATIAVFCIIIAALAVWILKPTEPRQVSRFYYEVPEGREFSNPLSPFFKVSPNGRQFVYCTTEGIYLQSIDELDAKLIAGTVDEDPSDPFFSPDGQWVGYWSMADEKLKKIPINGGAPIALADIDNSSGPSWCDDNTILYGSYISGIRRISADGGTPEVIIGQAGEHLISPQLLPDGKSVLFTKHEWVGGALQAVMESLETGERKVLIEGAIGVRYYPTGHLIYTIENDIFAAPFDPDKLEITGGQVPLLEDVFTSTRTHYDISDSGTLLYIPGTNAATGTSVEQRTLVWVDRNGKEEAIPTPPNDYGLPSISPDGTKVALSANIGDNVDIWVWDFARNTMTRLTFDDAADLAPLWTPDGKRIVFTSGRKGTGVYWKAADGTGEVEHLCSVPGKSLLPVSWSSDGKTMTLMAVDIRPISTAQNIGSDIGVMSMEGDREYRPLLEEKYLEANPRISPDGRWMVYTSNESGREEIYVRPFPEVQSGGRWQISTNGGSGPLWSPNGQELLYQSNEGMMVVDVETEPTFRPGNPKSLFRGTYYSPSLAQVAIPQWDIHPDGKRFLMIKDLQTTDEDSAGGIPHKFIVVTNWFEELKQRVPVD